MLQWNHDLAKSLDDSDFPLSRFELLQDWQRKRMQQTYADFMARPSDAPACHFFLQELYGGVNFRQRDHAVERVAPIMIRMLPNKALHGLTEAFRLQGISLELDIEMAQLLELNSIGQIDQGVYSRTYLECGRRDDRENQIKLIRVLGYELKQLVAMPQLLNLVKIMRKPAKLAGFGQLQSFLENGISSFGQLHSPAEFVDTIYQREWQLMLNWFEDGH